MSIISWNHNHILSSHTEPKYKLLVRHPSTRAIHIIFSSVKFDLESWKLMLLNYIFKYGRFLVKLRLLRSWGNHVDFWVVMNRFLCTFIGCLNLKRIWKKKSNLGELGLKTKKEKVERIWLPRPRLGHVPHDLRKFLASSDSGPFCLKIYFTIKY